MEGWQCSKRIFHSYLLYAWNAGFFIYLVFYLPFRSFGLRINVSTSSERHQMFLCLILVIKRLFQKNSFSSKNSSTFLGSEPIKLWKVICSVFIGIICGVQVLKKDEVLGLQSTFMHCLQAPPAVKMGFKWSSNGFLPCIHGRLIYNEEGKPNFVSGDLFLKILKNG